MPLGCALTEAKRVLLAVKCFYIEKIEYTLKSIHESGRLAMACRFSYGTGFLMEPGFCETWGFVIQNVAGSPICLDAFESEEDACFFCLQAVEHRDSIPAPASGAGLQSDQPARMRLPVARHVRKVLHDAPEVAPVNMREEVRLNLLVGAVLEQGPRRPAHGANRSLRVERHDRDVLGKLFIVLEALPKGIRKKRRRVGRSDRLDSRSSHHSSFNLNGRMAGAMKEGRIGSAGHWNL